MTYKTRAFRAARWTILSAIVRAALQLLQLALLSRILSIDDFGLIAIVMVVVGLLSGVSDLGVSTALLQMRNVSLRQRASVFWFSFFLGGLFSSILFFMSPWIAYFFSKGEAEDLFAIAAPVLVFSNIQMYFRSVMEKEFEFRPVVLVELLSALVGFFSIVFMAWYGVGASSVVIGYVMAAGFGAMSFIIILARKKFDFFYFDVAHLKPFVLFGRSVTGNYFVNYINSFADLVVGGKMLTTSQLGLYSLPRNLVLQIQNVINPIVTRISLPAIAHVQDEKSSVKSVYFNTLKVSTIINAPLYAFLFIFSNECVALLFGPQWQGAASVMQLLAVWGYLRSTFNPLGAVLIGTGNVALSLKWNASLVAVFISFALFGSLGGRDGMAIALILVYVLLIYPSWRFVLFPLTNASFFEYIICISVPAFLAFLAAWLSCFVSVSFDSILIRVVVSASCMLMLYSGFVFFINKNDIQNFLVDIRR